MTLGVTRPLGAKVNQGQAPRAHTKAFPAGGGTWDRRERRRECRRKSGSVGEEDLAAPFSHALHLFRPDPQRSICIGKRNSKQRAPVLVLGEGPGERPAGEVWRGAGRQRVLGSRCRRRSLGARRRARLLAELCLCRRVRPIYGRPRPWGPQSSRCHMWFQAEPCQGPPPPPRLRDWGTKARSEQSAEPGPSGRAVRPRGLGAAGLGPGTRPAPARLIYQRAAACVRPGKCTSLPTPSLPC